MSQEKLQMPWYTYALRCSDGSIYCGVTTDLARRLDEHNGVRPGGAKYTKTRRPVRLLNFWGFDNRSRACIAEAAFKKLRRKKKLEIINGAQNALVGLLTKKDEEPA